MSHLEQWNALVAHPDLVAAFEEHFAPLAQTDECRSILKDLAQCVEAVEVRGDELVFHIMQTDMGETGELTCSAPCDDVTGLPEAVHAIFKLHNGMSFPEDGWATNLNPWINGDFATGWDPSYAEDGDNPDYEDVDFSKMQVPIDNYSDWWVYDGKYASKTGEPGLSFFSHESCEFEEPLNLDFGVGGYFLRLVGNQVLESDDRVEDYCS